MNPKRRMSISNPMLWVTIFSIATVIAAFLQNKKESKEAQISENNIKSEFNKAVNKSIESSVKQIEEATLKIIDSLKLEGNRLSTVLKTKTTQLSKSIDSVNNDLVTFSKSVEDNFESIKNPLDPVLIDIDFTLDFTNADSNQLAILNTYRKYLESLGSYTEEIYALFQNGQLPKLILTYNQKKEITILKNTESSFEAYQPRTKYLTQFNIHELNFILAFLPSGFMFFNREDKDQGIPRFNSDLSFEFSGTSYGSKKLEKFEYHVNYEKKQIRFFITTLNPVVTNASGLVSGLRDCKSGIIGIGFSNIPGINYSINSLSLSYTPGYKITKQFPFHLVTPQIYFNDVIFLIQGKTLNNL